MLRLPFGSGLCLLPIALPVPPGLAPLTIITDAITTITDAATTHTTIIVTITLMLLLSLLSLMLLLLILRLLLLRPLIPILSPVVPAPLRRRTPPLAHSPLFVSNKITKATNKDIPQTPHPLFASSVSPLSQPGPLAANKTIGK